MTSGVDEIVDQIHDVAGPLDMREMADAFEHLQPATLTRFM
jgi:transposase